MYGNAIRPIAKVIKRFDGAKAIIEGLQDLAKHRVLVGVPESDAAREGTGEINNAQLAFLHSHGFKAPKYAFLFAMKRRYPGKPKEVSALEAYLMAKGSPYWNVPPRPFLEPSIEAHREDIAKLQGTVVLKALAGDKAGVNTGLNAIGIFTQANAKGWFFDSRNNWAPNHPLVIALKGSERPLVDTAGLLNSIHYVLDDDK